MQLQISPASIYRTSHENIMQIGASEVSLVEEIENAITVEEEVVPFKKRFFLSQQERIRAFLDDKIFPPYEVEVQSCSTCNAKCHHCWGKYLSEMGAKKLSNRLLDEENMKCVINKIIEAEANGLKVEVVKFVGSTGDPLMNPHTLDAIDILTENNVGTRLLTNGIVVCKYAERLIHLNDLRISLDAGCNDTWEEIKGVVPGKFEYIMEGIRSIRNLSEKQKTGIFIDVGYVITKDNHSDIYQAGERVKSEGAHRIQYRIDFTNPEYTPEQEKIIEEQLNKVQDISDDNFKVTKAYDTNPLIKVECGKCYYPYFWATIGSDGCLYPCGHRGLDYGWNIGDLLNPQNTLMSLFYEQRYNPRVKSLPDGDCRFCPPIGINASHLMDFLTRKSNRPGFQQALDTLCKKYLAC